MPDKVRHINGGWGNVPKKFEYIAGKLIMTDGWGKQYYVTETSSKANPWVKMKVEIKGNKVEQHELSTGWEYCTPEEIEGIENFILNLPPEKKVTNTMTPKLSALIDTVADSLESKGLIKEAYELDKIADFCDKQPIVEETIKAVYAKLQAAFQQLRKQKEAPPTTTTAISEISSAIGRLESLSSTLKSKEAQELNKIAELIDKYSKAIWNPETKRFKHDEPMYDLPKNPARPKKREEVSLNIGKKQNP